MRIKLNWSVNNLAISEFSSRQEFRGILGLSNINFIYRMSDLKTQEVAEMSKIFHLKRLIEKILEFLNATKVIFGNGESGSRRLRLCKDRSHWLATLSVSNNSSKNRNS